MIIYDSTEDKSLAYIMDRDTNTSLNIIRSRPLIFVKRKWQRERCH